MKRIALLFAWFAAAPFLIFLLPASWHLPAVDAVLPMGTMGLTWALWGEARTVPSGKWSVPRSLLAGFGCFLIPSAVSGLGYKLGWSDFTYGALQSSPALIRKILFLQFPLTIITTWLGYEWSLRGMLLGRCREKIGPGAGVIVAAVAGCLLQWPRLALASGAGDPMYRWAGLGELAGVELACGLLVMASGRLLPAVIFHAAMRATQMFFAGDVLDPYFPLVNYVSSNPLFYAARVGALLPPLIFLTGAIRRPSVLRHSSV